jgi:hypothetical protein
MKILDPLILQTNSVNNAKNAIQEFSKNATTHSNYLYGFSKENTVNELFEIVNNPNSFNPSNGAVFSGDSVIVSQYILKYRADAYVKIIIDLYNKGYANYDNGNNTIKFEPSLNIRKWVFTANKNEFAKATSQLFLYTIREYFNEIDYYKGAENTIWASTFLNNIWGISNIAVQHRIAQELLGFKCENYVERCQTDNNSIEACIVKVQDHILKGKTIITLVNSAYLNWVSKGKMNSTGMQNLDLNTAHYINILQLYQKDKKMVTMQWWDFGGIHKQSFSVQDFDKMIKGAFCINN